MKIFISNKFQGENKKILKKKLKEIILLLENSGYQTVNSFQDLSDWNARALPVGKAISWAFKAIKRCDAVLCFVDNPKPSQGMLLEVGFAKALNKKIILLISKKCSFPMLGALSDHVIKFKDWQDIKRKLKEIKI